MNICNEAAITAARKSKKKVDMRYELDSLPFSHTSTITSYRTTLHYYILLTLFYYTVLYYTNSDFESATDRVIGGLESKKVMSMEEKRIVGKILVYLYTITY